MKRPEEQNLDPRMSEEIIDEPMNDNFYSYSQQVEINEEEDDSYLYSTHFCTSNKAKEDNTGTIFRSESVNWSGIFTDIFLALCV